MKHLAAIAAHKHPEHLSLLIDELLAMDFEVIVHLDRKSKQFMPLQLVDKMRFAIDTSIEVKRGHISIVHSTLALMREAQKRDYDYFHLISGEDFPVKSKKLFAEFFETHNGMCFINSFALPAIDEYEKRSNFFNADSLLKDQLPKSNYRFKFFKDGIGLVDTYHFQESSFAGKVIGKLTKYGTFVKLYHQLFKRKLPKAKFYAGSAWFSLSKRSVDYILEFTDEQPELLKFMQNSLFPDEIYFQTILQNSELKHTIVNSDLRFIDWSSSNNHGPKNLEENDIELIKQSNAFFARKFNLNKDNRIYKSIKRELLS
jgi:hypothetical protein